MRLGVGVWGLTSLLLALAIALMACSPSKASPTSHPTTSAGIQLLLTTSDLAAEKSRFAFALLSSDGSFIEKAVVSAAFFRVQGNTAQLTQEALAVYRALEFEQEHVHAGGEKHIHRDLRGVYVADGIEFDAPGSWGVRVEVSRTPEGPQEATATFDVKARSATPPVGAPAPPTRQRTAKDVTDLKEVSSREPAIPAMHRLTIAEAVSSGKPSVIAFSTPAYCQSRVCGPVLESVIQVMPDYQGRVEFIHVEPYDLNKLRANGAFELVPAAKEWGLPSEPWTFVVDKAGRVAAKFEGIVTPEELKAALDRVLAA